MNRFLLHLICACRFFGSFLRLFRWSVSNCFIKFWRRANILYISLLFLTKIREDELANPITTLNYLQALFVLLNNYPGLLPEFKPDLDWLNSFNAKAKLATSAYIAEKTKYTIPFNFTQIRELFEDRFGKKTDPYTYISIYGEAPSRDDWGLVMINPPPMDGQKEKKMNYIVRGDDGIWTFYLNYI